MDDWFVDDVPKCPGTSPKPPRQSGGKPPGGRGLNEILADLRQIEQRLLQNRGHNQQYRPRSGDPFYIIALFAGVLTAIIMAAEGFQYPVSSAVFATAVVMFARWASKQG